MSTTPSITPSTPTGKVSTLGELPNPADRKYLSVQENALGASPEYFNGEKGRNLRSLEVHGVTVRLSSKEGERLAVYNGAKDIKKLVVWADTVEVTGAYTLHGCDVEINARVLKGARGTLTTSALPTGIPLIGNSATPTNKAADGQAGGSVKLNIYGATDADSTLPPITANGCPAQQIARFRTQSDTIELLKISLNNAGESTTAFHRSPFRDEALAKALRDPKVAAGSEPWRRADLSQDWEYFQWPELHKVPDGKSALGKITHVEVTLPPPPSGTRWNTGPYLLGRPEGPWTDDGSKYPAVGAGGPGGMVSSTIDVPSYKLKLEGGSSSPIVEATQQPTVAFHLKMVLGNPRQKQPATASFEKKQKRPPTRPAAVRARDGSHSLIGKSEKPSERQLSLMYQYAKDCYRGGYSDEAKIYLDRMPAVSKEQSTQLQEQLADAALLKSRLANHLDFYGNPPNWVPLLAVETNVGLFHGEIDHAIKSFYLSHLILSRWQNQDDRIQIVTQALEQARGVIAEHQQSMLKALHENGRLEGQVNMLTQQSNVFKTQLETLRNDLKEEAKRRANEEQSWQTFESVLNFLGAMASVIPVGQPYLGMGVTAIEGVLATTIDPSKSLNEKIAKLFEQSSTGLKTVASDETTKAAFEDLLTDYSDMQPLYDTGKELAQKKKKLLAKVIPDPDKRQLVEVIGKIEAHEKKISTASRKKAEEVTKITNMVSGVGDAAASVAALVRTLQVDKAEMEVRYEKLQSKLEQDSSRFQGIKAAFDLLSLRKEELLGKMLEVQGKAAQAAADRATAVTRLETLLREREKDVAVLNPDVKAFAERLEKDAADTLRKYYYFLVRSWEYCFLEPAEKAFDPTDLKNKTLAFLQGNDDSVTLTDQFGQLKTIYTGILSAFGRRLVEKLQSEMPRMNTDQDVTLGETDLSILNSPVSVPSSGSTAQTAKMRKVTINFEKLGRVPPLADDLRIANITLHPTISAAAPQKPLPENIVLRLWHSGTSVIVRNGVRYEFVSSGQNARMMWGVTYHSRDESTTPIKLKDDANAQILSDLFGDKVSEIRRYSPSYLGDLELVVLSDQSDREFRFDVLRLTITYEHHTLR
jgi:hypothetical protein